VSKRRHHYVPAFLLSRFASPARRSGRLCALDTTSGRPLWTSPSNVAVEKNYNTFAGAPEVDPLLPERVYEQVETAAAPLIARLAEEGASFASHERLTVALFISTLMLRGPRNRALFKEMDEDFARAFLSEIPPERFREFLEATGQGALSEADAERQRRSIMDSVTEGGVVISAPQARTIAFTLDSSLGLAETIAQMQWTVLSPQDGARFISSDSPFAMYDPSLPLSAGNAIASSPTAETTIPLGPTSCLELRPLGQRLRTAVIDWARVREINLRTYVWSLRWIYGQQHDVTETHRLAKRTRHRVAELLPREVEVKVRFGAEGLETAVQRRTRPPTRLGPRRG
jgi:hypothetical protein